jgi:hypothetical protein
MVAPALEVDTSFNGGFQNAHVVGYGGSAQLGDGETVVRFSERQVFQSDLSLLQRFFPSERRTLECNDVAPADRQEVVDMDRGAETTARYPKLGARGLGGSERAARWGMALGSYVGASNEETLLIPVIETKEASANIAGILSVPGLEAIFFLAGRPFAKLW